MTIRLDKCGIGCHRIDTMKESRRWNYEQSKSNAKIGSGRGVDRGVNQGLSKGC